LAHVRCKKFDFYAKFVYLGLMVRRLMLVQGSPELCDDKDYIGNKRAEAAGQMLALLFEDLFKKFNTELKREIDLNLKKYSTKDYDVTRLMNTTSITNGLVSSLSSGNWTVKRFKVEKKGVTQVLNRLSYVAAVGMMTRIESHIEKSRKVSGPRALQPSHWGMLCPSDTPDGENCGLVKSLALLAHITTETSEVPVFNLLLNLGVQEISHFSGLELHSGKLSIVFLNGIIVGVHAQHELLIRRFVEYRRRGKIGQFVSINYDKVNRFVNVSCDYGRLCRPYIIVKNQKPLLLPEHIKKIVKIKVTLGK
jgi:DNA-directed RNA polymerase III subunit RPC2